MTDAAKADDAWLPPLALAFYAAAAGTADLEAALDLSRETLAADSSFFYVSRLADESKLGAMARATKGTVAVPGVEFYAEDLLVNR